jgi:ABC-type nitrate/sulfonate/bicarbonate transport system ATPase subunit
MMTEAAATPDLASTTAIASHNLRKVCLMPANCLVEAIAGIPLSICAGEVVAVPGPNGCGRGLATLSRATTRQRNILFYVPPVENQP